MMNLLLHGIEGVVELADTLSPDGERLPRWSACAPFEMIGCRAIGKSCACARF